MPTSSRYRHLSRPSAPSCRGGASSLLRLAQPATRPTDLSGWMQRAAIALAPATLWPLGAGKPSIITLLAPSHELAAR